MIIVIVLLALSVLFNVILWRRNRSTSRKVSFLFNAIDNGDYSFRFPTEGRKEDKMLNASLNRIKEILQHARDEQIEREKYYEVIINSIDTGIIVMDEERGIVLRTNKAARQMLGRETITHISQVADKLKKFSNRESFTTLKGKKVKIIGFSDIHNELANQEVDAWVKLVRVLTHEIMNTITPIIALTAPTSPTASTAPTAPPQPSPFGEGDAKPQATSNISGGKDLASPPPSGGGWGEASLGESMHIIHDTSKELMDFVQNYRKFTHVPTPVSKLFYVKPFIERICSTSEKWLKDGCKINIKVEPKDLLVYADESLVSRVLSNLIKNAAEATANNGHIIIYAYTNIHDSVTIDVSDDGEPIPDDVAAQIFIPFFTTKKNGSGIGLSISRRIMRTMGGMLELVNNNRQKTFRLTFQ